jgi:LmbE family N-acetylglucosaminyl deacetylase
MTDERWIADQLDNAGIDDLWISPHLDDIALSAGGTAAARAGDGRRAAILTLFSDGDPRQPSFQLAEDIYDFWSAPVGTRDVARIWRARRDEDAAAAAALGCRAFWLGYLDALYRGYTTVPDLRGEPRASDAALFDRALAALSRLGRGRSLYFPLAIGGNVDHRFVFRLAWPLVDAGAGVHFYEDFPYARERPDSVTARLAEIPRAMRPELVDVTASIDARVAASGCYRTQVAMVFRHWDGDFEGLMRGYASELAGAPGRYAERLWRFEERE